MWSSLRLWLWPQDKQGFMSQLRNGGKVLSDSVSVWASLRWNIKQRMRSVLDFIMRLTPWNGASHRGPSDISVAQLNFFSPLNTTDLEGRSAGWPSSRHTLVWELRGHVPPTGGGADGAPPAVCECEAAAAGDLDFHRPVNPKYSWWSEFEPFELQVGGLVVHSGHGNIWIWGQQLSECFLPQFLAQRKLSN